MNGVDTSVDRAAEKAARQEKIDREVNAARSGKGTRRFVGLTRGKNPQFVEFEQFDESQPETLPASIAEFVELTKADESALIGYLIAGFNAASEKAASDPIAEYIGDWPDEVKARFRTTVRSYMAATGCSVEDAVALIRPGVEKALGRI